MLGVVVRRYVIVEECAGRRDLGTFLLPDEPDDESSEYTKTGETSYDTSSNSTSTGTSSPTRVTGINRWEGGTSSGAGTTQACRKRKCGYRGLYSGRFRLVCKGAMVDKRKTFRKWAED